MEFNEAKSLKKGEFIYHKVRTDSRGMPMRIRVASVRTWDKHPGKIKIAMKSAFGGYITFDENDLPKLTKL